MNPVSVSTSRRDLPEKVRGRDATLNVTPRRKQHVWFKVLPILGSVRLGLNTRSIYIGVMLKVRVIVDVETETKVNTVPEDPAFPNSNCGVDQLRYKTSLVFSHLHARWISHDSFGEHSSRSSLVELLLLFHAVDGYVRNAFVNRHSNLQLCFASNADIKPIPPTRQASNQ